MSIVCDFTTGCTNPGACNFEQGADFDDGSCDYYEEILNLTIAPINREILVGEPIEVYVDIFKQSEDNLINLEFSLFDQNLENEFISHEYILEIDTVYQNVTNFMIY